MPTREGGLPEALEDLAAGWLAAEARATGEPGRPELVEVARQLAIAYEAALAAGSLEDVRLAWEAARARQARMEMGSADWAAARRVSELLRLEDEAARPDR